MTSDITQIRASIARIREQIELFSDTFFSELFARAPDTQRLFNSAEERRRKLSAMLATFNNAKGLDKLGAVLKKVGERHGSYGVSPGHYEPLTGALLTSVRKVDPEAEPALLEQWEKLVQDIIELMEPAAAGSGAPQEAANPREAAPESEEIQVVDASLYDEVGGYETVKRVHDRFYPTLFDDEWLGVFFYGKSVTSLSMKQTRFMVAAFGGPDEYQWESPPMAHMHMYITDEQADIRETLLRNAIRIEGLSEDVEERWLKVDQAFRPAIVKEGVEECVTRCPGQRPVSARKPEGYRPPRLLSRDELVEAG